MGRTKKQACRAQWETFSDATYYDMWAVREKDDKDFNSPRLFHFIDTDGYLAGKCSQYRVVSDDGGPVVVQPVGPIIKDPGCFNRMR